MVTFFNILIIIFGGIFLIIRKAIRTVFSVLGYVLKTLKQYVIDPISAQIKKCATNVKDKIKEEKPEEKSTEE